MSGSGEDDGRPAAVPGPCPPRAPRPVLLELEVDGERFAVRRGEGGSTAYEWTSGPDQGYGFSSSGPPELPREQHERAVRRFLSMIDPRTGHLSED